MLKLQAHLRDYTARDGGLVIVSPIDIVFTDTDVLQPDIVVFTAARRQRVQLDEPIRTPPDVVVEVLSPGTVTNDRGRKLRMFERFGVPEYWMLDPAAACLEVRSLAGHDRYGRPIVFGGEARAASVALPGFPAG